MRGCYDHTSIHTCILHPVPYVFHICIAAMPKLLVLLRGWPLCASLALANHIHCTGRLSGTAAGALQSAWICQVWMLEHSQLIAN